MLRTVDGLSLHRHESLETVSTMNIHDLADRTEAVGGIDIALGSLVEIKSPVVPVGIPERIQIMMIRAFSVNDLAKQALLSHSQNCHLIEIIAAVLKHHTMLACLLRHVHKSPDVFKRRSRRNLNGYILTVFHRIEGNRNVMLPVCTDVDKINVITFAEFLVGLSVSGITRSLRESSIFQCLLSFFYTVSLNITEGCDLHSRNVGVACDSIRATHPDADKADTNSVHCRDSQPKNVFLAGRTYWSLNLDWTFLFGSSTRYRQNKR